MPAAAPPTVPTPVAAAVSTPIPVAVSTPVSTAIAAAISSPGPAATAIAALDLDLSPHDDKELVALFAFPEDRFALRESRVGISRPRRRLKSTSLSDISLLRIATGPHAVARVYPIRLHPGFHCGPSDNVERPLRTVRTWGDFPQMLEKARLGAPAKPGVWHVHSALHSFRRGSAVGRQPA
jgi:hypothetical protein